MEDEKKVEEKLCASCDRCRSRKTKCDGRRPCSNCAAKFMKKNKLSSIEGIPVESFDCVYSPAKRRGPVPRGSSQQVRKNADAQNLTGTGHDDWAEAMKVHQQQQQQISADGMMLPGGAQLSQFMGANLEATRNDLQQFSFLHQLQQQQQQQQQQSVLDVSESGEPSSRRVKLDETQQQQVQSTGGVPRTVSAHSHLLDRADPEGSRLLAYYKLSIDELFRLAPTPSDEEYCLRLNIPGLTPRMIPGPQLAALSAARFAEVALGALVHNEVSLAMELCNAVVHCLRESVQEPVQTSVLLEVAKAYFLLGVFRAFRGDMARYFKYRRVCMANLMKLQSDANTATLLAAISFLDSWAYMIYNGNESNLPNIDGTVPPLGCGSSPDMDCSSAVEMKYSVKTDVTSVLGDARNKNWIQGAPPVYLNNEAPLYARSLDALACAVRTCCDQANDRFVQLSKDKLVESSESDAIPQCSISTPTQTAVLAHEDELCSRNMVLSAYTLMQQYESSNDGKHLNEGHHLVISAMDAFLENSDESANGGFTDSQIQSLLSVCNTAIENPFLLHHAGPTYHMVTNAAVLLCHLLNGMHAMKGTGQYGPMETAMFEEILDSFLAIRKLLTIHRRKLPVKLRCHGIPRPSMESQDKEGQPFIDLGETLLCTCRGCQGFVLMACSPCVAAERARDATRRVELELAQEAEAVDLEVDQELQDLGAEFDVDDDALLSMISSLISG